MKQLQFIFLGIVLLLTACSAAATESVIPEPTLTIDDSSLTTDNAATAVKPQFIMFTASW